MKECPKHPGQETMIPCLKCGRYFCGLCESTPSSVHYCPTCSRELIDGIAERTASRELKSERDLRVTGKEAKASSEKTEGGVAAVQERSPIASVTGFMRDLNLRIRGKLYTVRSIEAAEKLSRWESSREEHEAEVRRKREIRKRARAGGPTVTSRVADWGRGRWSGAVESLKRLLISLEGSSPVGLEEKKTVEGETPVSASRIAVILIMLGAVALWILSLFVFHRRWWFVSLIIGVLVGWCCVMAFRGLVGLRVGVIACLVAVFSILIGDLFVQLLYRLDVLSGTSIPWDIFERSSSAPSFYSHFLLWYIFAILLTAAAAAFLVGFWPLPLRPYWKSSGRSRGRSDLKD